MNTLRSPLPIAALLVAASFSSVLAAEPAETLTPERAFALLKTYDFAQPRAPLAFLEQHIAEATDDAEARAAIAARLLTLLTEADTTHAAKLFICKQLPLVGTADHVPVLVKMLDDARTVDMARRALEGIPGDEAGKALREALTRLEGPALIGTINSLGARRDAESVGALAKLTGGGPSWARNRSTWVLNPSVMEVASPAAGPVAMAALQALGRIGTKEAASVLLHACVAPDSMWVLRDAQLRCAQLLAADGDAATAKSVYVSIVGDATPAQWRIGALSGMAQVDPDAALRLALDAMDADDDRLRRHAMRVTLRLSGSQVTAALTDRLGQLPPAHRAELVGVIAERGDRSAAGAVAQLVRADNEVVRVAALRAMGALGDASSVSRLARVAASESGAAQEAARRSLGRLSGPGVDQRMLAAVEEGDAATRAEVCRAIAARRVEGATQTLLKASAHEDAHVREAALSALAMVGTSSAYRPLLQALVSAKSDGVRAAAEDAVLTVGDRLPDLGVRVDPVIAAMKTAPAQSKPALLRVLQTYGGASALAAVRACLDAAQPELRAAAVSSLAGWPDASPADDLLRLAKQPDATNRALALRGYLRMATQAATPDDRLKMLDQVRPIATTKASKNLLLSSLAKAPDPATLEMAMSFVDDGDVRAEAMLAAVQIAKGLLKTDRAALLEPMKKLAAGGDEVVAKQAQALYAEALKRPASEASKQAALQPNRKRSAAYRKALSERAPEGYHLACYLDCGPDRVDEPQGAPKLRAADGDSYVWQSGNATADQLRFLTIAFAGKQVTFQLSDLDPKREYQLGFSWWDYDHDTRAQSVWASAGMPARRAKLLGPTKLPAGGSDPPAEHTVPLPRELTAQETVQVAFVNEGSPNVVVSEVWLWESDAESEVKVAAEYRPNATPVLLVTGVDLHNWRATTPVLVEQLEKDKRLRVEVVEDPNFLASPKIHDYPVHVMHWMDWEVEPPGKQARENLARYVREGGGLVLVHFACGAFQEWPEFANIAGRVWDPKLRGHDPRGPFRVEITEVDHPITRGVSAFDTDDELYTCLTGDKPIEVLATAVSKVDKKVYPMAFVHHYGKGRVFHCVLGHDARALEPDAVGELFRRGTAWAAGLVPVAQASSDRSD